MKKALPIILALWPAVAWAATPPEVSFGPFPLPLKRAYMVPAMGKPSGFNPFSDGFLTRVTVAFEDIRSTPSHAGHYGFFSRNIVTVYNLASNSEGTSDGAIREGVQHLQELLRTRPAGVPVKNYRGDPYLQYEFLPEFPPPNATHIIQSKVSYADFAWGSGVFYITGYAQGNGDTLSNDSMFYLFQGISKTEDYYVSAKFRITHPIVDQPVKHFPEQMREDSAHDDVMAAVLPKQPDSSFIPSLSKLRKFMGTWMLGTLWDTETDNLLARR